MRLIQKTNARALPAWLCVSLLMGLAGCDKRPRGPRYEGAGNPKPRDGGTFVFHHESNVRTLDPHLAYDELSNMAIRLLYDGLLDYDEQSNLIPSLAETMPTVSEDGKTFRFRLRRGVRFHPMPGLPKGRELIAEDIRWSLEHLLSGDVASPGFPFFRSIKGAEAFHSGNEKHIRGIRVLDRYTIEFTLSEADQTFLNSMAMTFAYPVPKENYARRGDQVGQYPVGTGPYMFQRWERGVQIEFVRNPRYFAARPGPNRMVYLENVQRYVASLRFQNGGLDAIHRYTPAHRRLYKTARRWKPHRKEFAEAVIYGLVMNCELPPFDNVHVRRAVAFALDRKGWAKARGDAFLPTGQFLPPSIAGHVPRLENRQRFDLARAKREMREAGFARGLRKEIVLWVGEGDSGRFYGELVQNDLAKIGIRVRVRQVSFAVYLEETAKPKTVQAFMSGWAKDFPDAASFFDPVFHSRSIRSRNSQNRSFYRNSQLDALLDAARIEQSPSRRAKLYQQASRIVTGDAPWAFVYNPLSMHVWQPYVRGYGPHPVWDKDYRSAWLDLPRRRVAHMLTGRRFAKSMASLFPFGPLMSKRFAEGRFTQRRRPAREGTMRLR